MLKNKKYLVSFADEKFLKSQQRLEKSAKKYFIDHIISVSPDDYIKSDFYIENYQILSQKRGCGYWLWKPYIIIETLKKLNEDDFLVYCDSGVEFINDIEILLKICETKKHLILFQNSPQHQNIKWTKRETFELMDMDNESYWYSPQITASFMILQKNEFNMKFLNEWFEYCKNERILTDIPSIKKEYSEFIEHRHDQSIISLLAQKYNLELFRDPSQWGNAQKIFRMRRLGEFKEGRRYDKKNIKNNSPYLQIFNQHREHMREYK